MKGSFFRKLSGLARIFLCGILTGIFTAMVILLYKICAEAAIFISHSGYTYIREHLYLLPVVIMMLGGIAVITSYIYRTFPYLQGGGIPTSIGILRGFLVLDWLKSLIGTFVLSVVTFIIGVPLGNEGPSVQMGTAVGRGVVKAFPKSRRALDKYAMTGGACAGFSSATGAPISGMLFAIEEAHGRFSPLVLLVAAVSVLSARAVLEWLAPLCGVNVALFPHFEPIILPVYDLWLPLVVGITVGLFSVLFLKYYDILHRFLELVLKKCHNSVLIFIIFAFTLGMGLCSFSFVSTGHELIIELFDNRYMLPLLLILLVRATLGLGANAAGITGGVFVPILALGALVSAILCSVLKFTVGLSDEYCLLVLLLGISACIAGTMKMPLTAVTFAVEALSCHGNLLSVITVTVTAFAIAELFGADSINEHVLERKLKNLYADKVPLGYNEVVTVQQNSFVEGKRVRDVLWPANLFILSVSHNSNPGTEAGQVEDTVLTAGDVLNIRYTSFDKNETIGQLVSMVGEQIQTP